MNAYKVSETTLFTAAQRTGVMLDVAPKNAARTSWRVKVNPLPLSRKWQRINGATGRKVHAVCWHGFRDFFRACFELEPGARFKTAFDTWNGAADFEERFRFSGYKNIGSRMCPVQAAEACECPDSGYAG